MLSQIKMPSLEKEAKKLYETLQIDSLEKFSNLELLNSPPFIETKDESDLDAFLSNTTTAKRYG